MTEIKLSLEPNGDDFSLLRTDENGLKTSIFLSESDVIFLGQLLRTMKAEILAKRSTALMEEQGIEPVIMLPLAHFGLNTDLHESEILLEFHDAFGNKHGFALSAEGAKTLSDGLSRWAQKLEAAQSKNRAQ